MNLSDLQNISTGFKSTPKMPTLFFGHGSPMNAIEENEFVANWRKVAASLPKPNAILCISAHWITRGTAVTAMAQPRTIHDFGGFPQELFNVHYPAKGNPELAEATANLITGESIHLDHQWGLDHGAWSVIRHLYPEANIPIVQLSLDAYKSPQEHYKLAKELAILRRKGILIIGSGNIVHNLRRIDWPNMNKIDHAFDWAREADNKIKKLILIKDHNSLQDYHHLGAAVNLAVPTSDHYLPLLYTLALQEDKDELEFFNDKAVGGSLTMTSLKLN
ncbi:Aromatic ring-opening dioxygenase, catalytic subunit, LigB family [Zunongwangia mangrovi]|uniref:Aromatic ring-opening dioxygenase, catalytic subunit, LigB family n=1 Tax=Zunongwangia mangrovi TaxID=1334022 RepID=A0A1I1G2Q3_9FLAO|nr:4,5-DOPA dioxygenase extradiol [Zunongwangia mangrovi]SFC05572.1 Aromatic ring-opening dioxygenase, catalytic subunit, LigB family [Zunongwangia mangrovi]